MMESRIQFRVDDRTKKLAQLTAERRGTTLSDECRRLTEELAEEQAAYDEHDSWLQEEVNKAYELYNSGQSQFVEHDEALQILEDRKNKIRSKHKLEA
jgi:antitoxin component of RelBE/YafQ-DinJ toxin-antitoxin module